MSNKFEKYIKEQDNKNNEVLQLNKNSVDVLSNKFEKYIKEQENKNSEEIQINKNSVKELTDKFEKYIKEQVNKNNEITQINKNINKMEENISIIIPNILYPGIIVAFNGTIIPSGWQICDGTNNTPDLRGRFILSSGNGIDLSTRLINDIGGSETHTLNIDEIPGHTHNGTTSSNGAHIHSTNANGIDVGLTINNGINNGMLSNLTPSGENNIKSLDSLIINSSGTHTHTFTTNSTGNNNSHNNMPPFYVLAYIMRL